MKEPVWAQNPLEHLLGSMPVAEFFRDYYEKAPLLCRHNEPARYSDLISIERIDSLLANSELPPGALQMARKEPAVNRQDFTYKNGAIDRGAVLHHFQHGATIILPQLHLAVSSLSDLCRAMENLFSTHVQTNIYLTPANNQGFNTHYDDHDVFIIQVCGEKKWQLYQQAVSNPYRGEKFQARAHKAGDVEQEFTLTAGDCLYLPRGLMHDAVGCGSEPSLHITVGLLSKRWADLMLEAMSEVALRMPEFRRSLPPGFVREDFDVETAKKQFASLAASFVQEADFTEAFELFRETFLRERGPDLPGALLSASRPFSADNKYRLRRYAQTLLRYDDTELILICGGGELHFDRNALLGLQTVISGETVDASLFKDLGEDLAKATIEKLLAFGVVEPVY